MSGSGKACENCGADSSPCRSMALDDATLLKLPSTLTVAKLIESLKKMPQDVEVPAFRIEFKFEKGTKVVMQRKRQAATKKG